MTKIKLCGLSRPCDIESANALMPEYIGFVFLAKSKRYVPPKIAMALKEKLDPDIKTVGVFVNEKPERVASLLENGVIDIAQLHGDEDEHYIARLREYTNLPIIKAFRIENKHDLYFAQQSTANYILLDSGAGTGTMFNWSMVQNIDRPYFLAGGLSPENVKSAIKMLHPYAVDVSSGIETNGYKDKQKTEAFVFTVRKENEK